MFSLNQEVILASATTLQMRRRSPENVHILGETSTRFHNRTFHPFPLGPFDFLQEVQEFFFRILEVVSVVQVATVVPDRQHIQS
jgi:hypothetical protein